MKIIKWIGVTIQFGIIVLSAILLPNPEAKVKIQEESTTPFAFLNEEILDILIKTQIERNYYFTNSFVVEQIKTILEEEYEQNKNRHEFDYNNPASHHFYYIYPDKEKAEAKEDACGTDIMLLECINHLKENNQDYRTLKLKIIEDNLSSVEEALIGLKESGVDIQEAEKEFHNIFQNFIS
jgi:hypothetical protein